MRTSWWQNSRDERDWYQLWVTSRQSLTFTWFPLKVQTLNLHKTAPTVFLPATFDVLLFFRHIVGTCLLLWPFALALSPLWVICAFSPIGFCLYPPLGYNMLQNALFQIATCFAPSLLTCLCLNATQLRGLPITVLFFCSTSHSLPDIIEWDGCKNNCGLKRLKLIANTTITLATT